MLSSIKTEKDDGGKNEIHLALVADEDIKKVRDYLISGDLISLFASHPQLGCHGYLYSEG